MSSIFQLIVILVPLLLVLGLAVFFIRLFKKTSVQESRLIKELASLEAMKRNAVWSEAKIMSVHAELPSRFNIATRILNLNLEIKDDIGNCKIYKARWSVDTVILSSLQPDSVIQVKVYNELVFPTIDGAKIQL